MSYRNPPTNADGTLKAAAYNAADLADAIDTSLIALGGDLTGTAANAQLAADCVTATEIAAGAVGTSELASLSITAGKIQLANVTNPTLADMAQSTIKGRAAAAGTGQPNDLTAAEVRTLIGSPTKVVLAAGDLQIGQGSPATTNVTGGLTRWRVWLMDAASQEGVVGMVVAPSWATTVACSVLWAATTANTTDAVVWLASRASVAAAVDLTGTGSNFSGGNTTATCNGTHVVVATSLGTHSVVGSSLYGIQIARIAANASDTYSSDAEIVCLDLTFS